MGDMMDQVTHSWPWSVPKSITVPPTVQTRDKKKQNKQPCSLNQTYDQCLVLISPNPGCFGMDFRPSGNTRDQTVDCIAVGQKHQPLTTVWSQYSYDCLKLVPAKEK